MTTKRLTRQERVDQMVEWGYSREFAEAYIPMTVAEVREKNLMVQQYESPFTVVNRAMGRKRSR